MELQVILPENLRAFFRESGYLPTTAEEHRGNARLRVRSDGELEILSTPDALESTPPVHAEKRGKILVKDLSRSGIGILFHEQLYPMEVFNVYMQGRTIHAVAVRCRKLGPKCYETGGRVLEVITNSL